MNILEVIECSGGVGVHVSGLCAGLAAQGHQVTVAYSPDRLDGVFRQFVDEQHDGVRFFPLEVGREVSAVSDLRAVLQLLRLTRRKGRFDVIHGHSSKGGAIARIVGRLAGIPTVYTPHSLILSSPYISRTEAAFYTLVERFLGHLATSKFIAVSRDERDFAVKLGLVPKKRISVIENTIDDERFDPSPERAVRADLHQKPLTFGATIRFTAQKAPDQLIEGFIRLSRALPGIPMRLVVVGDGELFSETKERIEASGLAERISLPGWVADTRAVLSEFDVYVASSLYEGFPYAILEAMAAKLPVVSTDVFGTGETIALVPGNVVVPVGDPAALADGMRRMATLAEPDSLRRALSEIGSANHDHARTRFGQDEVTRRTLRIYQELR